MPDPIMKPEKLEHRHFVEIPGTSYVVEIAAYAPPNGTAYTHVKLRDTSLEEPAFDPLNFLAQGDYNTIKYWALEADTSPIPLNPPP